METRKVSELVWRDDLYPRITHDPEVIQRYAASIDKLPAIEVNQNNEIIDGYHRWTAHRKENREDIAVTVTQTKSDAEFLVLSIERNAKHGLQLSNEDKKRMARKVYLENKDKNALADMLSVSSKTITRWVDDIDEADKEERERIIKDMWLACYTQEEIADVVGMTHKSISNKLEDMVNLDKCPKGTKLSAEYQETDWTPPLYDMWTFAKNANHKHFGNTHVGIVDNLLYTFTKPFDIIVDPFAGGGSTIDICKKRLRRYWVSDRLPIVEREQEIRKHDLTDGVSGPYHWEDVSLVYLDPPYWKQAEGKYSNDPEDLANMTLDKFYETLTGIVMGYASKMKPGSHIALIISPTQWPNDNKETIYHDIDLANKIPLKLERRAVCPYSTEQYNGTQVNIAKEQKLWMVLSRTLLVWEVK